MQSDCLYYGIDGDGPYLQLSPHGPKYRPTHDTECDVDSMDSSVFEFDGIKWRIPKGDA